ATGGRPVVSLIRLRQRVLTPDPFHPLGLPDSPSTSAVRRTSTMPWRVSTLRYLQHEVGRKAVVIVAMSGDSKSESTLEDALEVLLQNDVIAYVLQIYDPPRERSRVDHCDVIHTYERDEHGEELLKKLAEATGGRMLEVRGINRLTTALDEISDELHHQYSLGYYPANQNWDGRFRRIQIVTRAHGYKVFARKGYYAHPKYQAMR